MQVDTTAVNGALTLVPGSHRWGMLDGKRDADSNMQAYGQVPPPSHTQTHTHAPAHTHPQHTTTHPHPQRCRSRYHHQHSPGVS